MGLLRGSKKKPLWGICIGVYAGQYYDQETGFHYNWNRYYDPATGRYVEIDPSYYFHPKVIGIPYLLPTLKDNPAEYNIYSYVKNNPLIYIDFAGLACGTGWTDRIVPDKPYGYDFTASCEWHDSCYEECGKSRSFCDIGFLRRMQEICSKYSNSPIRRKSGCMGAADTYYIAVVVFGKKPYCNAQYKSGCCPMPKGCK